MKHKAGRNTGPVRKVEGEDANLVMQGSLQLRKASSRAQGSRDRQERESTAAPILILLD